VAAELTVGGCDDEDQPGEPYGTGYRGPARILRGRRIQPWRSFSCPRISPPAFFAVCTLT
jgi:hypothetical protein